MAASPNCAGGRAHQLIKIPDGVAMPMPRLLPVAYGTRWRMMVTNGHIAKGEKVLILGASAWSSVSAACSSPSWPAVK